MNNSYLRSNKKSQDLNGHSREQVQEVLSIASEQKFGLGGNIIMGLSNPANGNGSFSRNSLTQSGYNTIQSDLTAFGNCPFNASNLSLSVYGDKSILGGQGVYGHGPRALINNPTP